MPLDEKRKKELFSGLGRPTKRGIKKCPKCGTLNGTRGNSCKNKSCDVIFRNNGTKKKPTTDACRIIVNNSAAEIYSVRLRDRGPDYRSFVQLTPSHPSLSSLSSTIGHDTTQPHGTFPKCFVSACNRNRVYPCTHIKAAQKCFTTSQRILVKLSALDTLRIPQECKQILAEFVTELPDLYVQRCSKTSFVVKCSSSSRHPLGYLHVLFFKPNKEDSSTDPKFLCTCRPFKVSAISGDKVQISDNSLIDSPNKLCIHYYSCMWAFASNESLAEEFDYLPVIISQQTSLEPNALSILERERESEGEPMDTNRSSAVIIRENVSLLDGIAGADETALTTMNNVQLSQLDATFPDHIIVTNSENRIIFTGNTVIEGMEEVDSRHLTQITEMLERSTAHQQMVCQIYPSQLQDAFIGTGSELGPTETVHVLTEAVLSTPDASISHENAVETSGEHVAIDASNCVSSVVSSINSVVASSVASSTPQVKTTSVYSVVPAQPLTHTNNDLEKKLIHSQFERWLASVNERINASMNYRLPGQPNSLVYYVCNEFFEILKERITSGWKKKRLPNQTRVVEYRERAPIGNFMKHVWKITNIVHILNIFRSTLVPLKINQFFVQNSNGNYSEWIPSNDVKEDEGPKTKSIIPVLHSTSLKIGKTDVTAKESVPFTIEWIPNILPQSHHGELTLTFQFTHTGPIHTNEDRRLSVAPLQKLIQSQVLPS